MTRESPVFFVETPCVMATLLTEIPCLVPTCFCKTAIRTFAWIAATVIVHLFFEWFTAICHAHLLKLESILAMALRRRIKRRRTPRS